MRRSFKTLAHPVLLTGLATILTYLAFSLFPILADRIYGDLIFPAFRLFFDIIHFVFPIPIFLVLIPIVLSYFFYRSINLLFMPKKPFRGRMLDWSKFVILLFLALASGFYWLWGFNYLLTSPIDELELRMDPIEQDRLFEMLEQQTAEINVLRTSLSEVEVLNPGSNFSGLSPDYRSLSSGLQFFLRKHGFLSFGEFRLRYWWPEGILLRNSSAGMFFPFTGEPTIDPGLHPLQKPFTATHEMAHAAGFTDEGFCNLVAWLVCIHSEDEFIRYAGKLALWRYTARAASRLNRERYLNFIENHLIEEVIGDLHAIQKNSERFPDFFPGLQRRVYDTYLRAHGVQEGIASYSNLLMLVESYRSRFD